MAPCKILRPIESRVRANKGTLGANYIIPDFTTCTNCTTLHSPVDSTYLCMSSSRHFKAQPKRFPWSSSSTDTAQDEFARFFRPKSRIEKQKYQHTGSSLEIRFPCDSTRFWPQISMTKPPKRLFERCRICTSPLCLPLAL